MKMLRDVQIAIFMAHKLVVRKVYRKYQMLCLRECQTIKYIVIMEYTAEVFGDLFM